MTKCTLLALSCSYRETVSFTFHFSLQFSITLSDQTLSPSQIEGYHGIYIKRERETERGRETERERQRERDRDRERKRERERERKRDREREKERQRDRETEREREREREYWRVTQTFIVSVSYVSEI